MQVSNQDSRWSVFASHHIVRALEVVQDLIVVSLCLGLFSFMVLEVREMFLSLLPPLNFHEVTADIMFLLILVELFRLLIIYLQEQRVSIGVAVEVSIVSVLREIIVRGVLEASFMQVLAACALLLVLGGLLVIRVWLPPTFEGIDPEKQISERRRRERLGRRDYALSAHVDEVPTRSRSSSVGREVEYPVEV
ncbi:MAG: phosphate-starvation-inducible PsiE family protein [Synechococcales cyanobacterium T60_A2020_003]|nr:phosphate-starvation-inducible PsiE family protein [Synechococcales cyanobacterium T60_A2020_003]